MEGFFFFFQNYERRLYGEIGALILLAMVINKLSLEKAIITGKGGKNYTMAFYLVKSVYFLNNL